MTTPVSVPTSRVYQTLASEAGAPQVSLAWASTASVVASVVSPVSLVPRVTAFAPVMVSLPGAAGSAGWAPSARTRSVLRRLVRTVVDSHGHDLLKGFEYV